MNYYEYFLLDIILILFPILVYLLYLTTNKNIEKSNKEIFFDLAVLSSFYLVYRVSFMSNKYFSILIMNIPILLAYLKHEYIVGNIIILMILFIFRDISYIYIIIMGLVLSFAIYIFRNKFKLSRQVYVCLFVFINLVFYIIWNCICKCDSLMQITITSFIYLLMTFIISLMYIIGERIISHHMTFKQLQEEKQIRLSLFKITHEIKNPIAVIKGYLDMMDLKNKKQVSKYIPIIKNEIERLLNLLQDFLLVNKSTMDMDIMDINMLIEDTLSKLSYNDNILIKYKENDEVFINGDYNRLQQVLINIIKNSIESIPNNKKGAINIALTVQKNNVRIIISDNGIGMDKNTLSKIKEPFYTTKLRGSGLGVSLSYEIIEAHKGKIVYESEEFSGTKVSIELPIN